MVHMNISLDIDVKLCNQ